LLTFLRRNNNVTSSQVSFKGIEASEALAADIQDKIDHLERMAPALAGCRVIVEAPHKKKHHGFLYRVVIHATLSGRELVVGGTHDEDHAHEDPYVAVRDAFAALRRQLDS